MISGNYSIVYKKIEEKSLEYQKARTGAAVVLSQHCGAHATPLFAKKILRAVPRHSSFCLNLQITDLPALQ